MIRKVNREDIPECVKIIKNSFMTVAEEFAFTAENAPFFTAFATTEEKLYWQMDNEKRLMFLYEEEGIPCGYYALLIQDDGECELNNLSVLPEYRHKGIGKKLLEHAYQTAAEEGIKIINIGIVEENQRLRRWYEDSGAVHVGTKKFDFFPFTCGYLKKEI
jgi:GNAT superfamily N-acetyltransferase